jgi:hypothetical protein
MRGTDISGSCGIGERGRTGSAAPSLNAALTEVTESLAGLVLASGAGHVISPLAFCEETSQNRFSRSKARVTPRFGLAPTSVDAEAGALSVSYDLGWWLDRDFHGLTSSGNSDSDSYRHRCFILPESPAATGLSHLTPKPLRPVPNRRSHRRTNDRPRIAAIDLSGQTQTLDLLFQEKTYRLKR